MTIAPHPGQRGGSARSRAMRKGAVSHVTRLLFRSHAIGTSRRVTPPDIFDRAARCLRRDRAAPHYADFDFLRAAMLDGIADRLATVKRDFADVLDLGSFDGSFVPPPGTTVTRLDAGGAFARMAGGIQNEEDQPRFAEGSFDLVVSAGVLDSVNDLPGALALARRALRPDGLFLAAFTGAGSLATLRATLREAESERPAARIHPQIDVRSAGDLLVRAGFALPVADVEGLTVRYADLFGLMRDLRGMAATNVLTDRQPLTRATLARAAHAFSGHADPDGRVPERFEIIYLTGWAPAPSQPQPARRGSGRTSLAEALKPRD
jgi:SAM-dependent methyltransferase